MSYMNCVCYIFTPAERGPNTGQVFSRHSLWSRTSESTATGSDASHTLQITASLKSPGAKEARLRRLPFALTWSRKSDRESKSRIVSIPHGFPWLGAVKIRRYTHGRIRRSTHRTKNLELGVGSIICGHPLCLRSGPHVIKALRVSVL